MTDDTEVKLHSTIDIDADADAVWPYVANPVLQSAWNEKIVAVDRPSDVIVTLGESFAMMYRMNGTDRESQVEVTVCDAPHAVTYRHTMTDGGKVRFAEEQYELTPLSRHRGVRLRQTIDMAGMGIPWFVRALFWFITKFGTPRGPEPLEELKKLIERQPAMESAA